MKKVYVLGPIHLFGKSYLPVYKKVNKLCKKYFDKVIGTYPDFWNPKETPRQFYNLTDKVMNKCDLLIAEISSPSTGVGMELQMAEERKIPVIALCKKGVKPSIMAIGIPAVKKVVFYKNLDDLLEQLELLLKKR